MQSVRVAFPAVVGALMVLVGFVGVSSGFSPGRTGGVLGGVHDALVPIGIGVFLVLTALAIAKRTRLGWMLGQVVAVLLVLAGGALIVAELPYLDEGGISGALAAPFMVIAAVWSLAWAAYGWRLRKGRSTFAPDWQPNDRRLGSVIGGLVVFVGGAWFALGAVQGQVDRDYEAGFTRARALVAATGLEVSVLDAAFDAGPTATVNRLTINVTLTSPEGYALLAPPTLCLTDSVTFEDPAYKPDGTCWGTSGPALVLAAALPNTTVPAGTTTFRVELVGAGSRCAFGAGLWNAGLTLAPRIDELPADGTGPAPEQYALNAPFSVESDGGALPPSGTVPPAAACLGVSP